ncbi:MAG: nucleotidyltransferase domain-containing protein [Alphaproteobacteria bacterium]|nr:nucleotidyltransferase domain-containing protein [Alphaproteobacteria bacterium]
MDSPGTLIFETVHGSRAYGTDGPGSDLDLKGVLVGPADWYHGFQESPEQIELHADHVRYELRKFMRLAAGANPTLLELLWTDPSDHRVVTPAGQRLLDAREAFLSARVKDSFGGYAIAQLKRIRTHRRWLLHPPEGEPQREAYGLPPVRAITKDQQGAAEAMLERGTLSRDDIPPNFLELLSQERRYRAARREWQQYRTWVQHRNPARAELEARFGYDTKHALHLVRLLRMGAEILETGRLQVRRPDAEELLAIKRGAWTYDQLMAHADALEARVAQAAEASTLPPNPDLDRLNRLCVEIVEEVLHGRRP